MQENNNGYFFSSEHSVHVYIFIHLYSYRINPGISATVIIEQTYLFISLYVQSTINQSISLALQAKVQSALASFVYRISATVCI